jgi:hypothetical protein
MFEAMFKPTNFSWKQKERCPGKEQQETGPWEEQQEEFYESQPTTQVKPLDFFIKKNFFVSLIYYEKQI